LASEISWSLSLLLVALPGLRVFNFLQPLTLSESSAQKLHWFFFGDPIVAFPGPMVSILLNNAT
jgi:hypothetical protein